MENKPQDNNPPEYHSDFSSEDEDVAPKTSPNRIKRKKRLFPQIMSAVVASWLSIIVGYASAYSSPSEMSIMRDLNVTKTEISWIGSLLPVGALIGSLTGSPVIEHLGRKTTLVVTDAIFLTGWTANCFAKTFWGLYASRLVCGYGVGLASFTLPIYLAETVQHKIRGRLGLLPTVFGNLGILLCFALGNIWEWRGLAFLCLGLTFPFFLGVWFIPETPHWLIRKKKNERARKSLQFLRGSHYDINREMDGLLNSNASRSKKRLFSKSHFKALAIVLSLMFFQQFSGVNAVIFYTTEIFQESKSAVNAYVSTAIVGAVNFLSTFLATALVDQLGRKILLYVSSALMALALIILSLYFYCLEVTDLDLDSFHWVPLAVLILYVLGFSFGMGPVPWLMMGEILPSAVRGPAAAFCAAFNWTCTFIITKSFPSLEDLVGVYTIFAFFACIILISIVFVRILVPETKKRTLEEIEAELAAKTTFFR